MQTRVILFQLDMWMSLTSIKPPPRKQQLTLYWPKLLTTQVNCTSRPCVAVRLSSGWRNSGSCSVVCPRPIFIICYILKLFDNSLDMTQLHQFTFHKCDYEKDVEERLDDGILNEAHNFHYFYFIFSIFTLFHFFLGHKNFFTQ